MKNLVRSGEWIPLPVVGSEAVHAIAVSEHRLYVVAGRLKIMNDIDVIDIGALAKAILSKKPLWSILRSTDQGVSWIDITPPGISENKVVTSIRIVAEGKKVLLFQEPNTLHSVDEGKTWSTVHFGKLTGQGLIVSLDTNNRNDLAQSNHIYVGDQNGIRRSTDGGNTWKRFNAGLGGNIQNILTLDNKLYAIADGQLIASTDGGHSWTAIPVDLSGKYMTVFNRKIPLKNAHIREITESDGVLYAKCIAGIQQLFCYLDKENGILLPIEAIPTFDEENSILTLMKPIQTSLKEDENEDVGENASSFMKNFLNMGADIYGGFAVSNNTFYVEYKRKLLIWNPSPNGGDNTTWYDTEIEDPRQIENLTSIKGVFGFKIAANGDAVYVGKPDGVLLHSADKGRTWKTMVLPLKVESFEQILSTDEGVYVATDKQAIYTHDNTVWNIVTDANGQQLIIDHFAKDGKHLYAVSSSKDAQGGVYRLRNEDTSWEKITPVIPDKATSLTVSNGILYVGTKNSGLQLSDLKDLLIKRTRDRWTRVA